MLTPNWAKLSYVEVKLDHVGSILRPNEAKMSQNEAKLEQDEAKN